MKKILSLAIAASLAPLSALAADSVSWTNWATMNSGSLTQNSNVIAVTYAGDAFDVDHSSYFYNVPSSFTSAEVTNTPDGAGSIRTSGGTPTVNHFHFSQAVIDPYMVIFSAGQAGVPVSFNFSGVSAGQITLLSGGPGNWGGQALTQSGTSIWGEEGNGTLKLTGSFTDVYFTTPQSEFYYGFSIGAAIAAVPEPATYGMLAAGLGLLGLMARRRKQG